MSLLMGGIIMALYFYVLPIALPIGILSLIIGLIEKIRNKKKTKQYNP